MYEHLIDNIFYQIQCNIYNTVKICKIGFCQTGHRTHISDNNNSLSKMQYYRAIYYCH